MIYERSDNFENRKFDNNLTNNHFIAENDLQVITQDLRKHHLNGGITFLGCLIKTNRQHPDAWFDKAFSVVGDRLRRLSQWGDMITLNHLAAQDRYYSCQLPKFTVSSGAIQHSAGRRQVLTSIANERTLGQHPWSWDKSLVATNSDVGWDSDPEQFRNFVFEASNFNLLTCELVVVQTNSATRW